MSATPQDIDTFLQAHSEWSRITDGTIAKIMRRYKFRNFKSALAFANLVGDISEEANHHPDILVSWGRAEITWWTHDTQGLSQLDLDLAASCDRAFDAF